MNKSDPIDAELLNILQTDFPLVSRPFDEIAYRLHINTCNVLSRIAQLKENKIIRQISAIFNSSALGYKSALAAFQVNKESLEKVALKAAHHPAVSHCYSRNSIYNLWFTITVKKETDIQHEVEKLSSDDVLSIMFLPAIRTYKIGVFFNMTESSHILKTNAISKMDYHIEPIERTAVKALQKDIPLATNPFKILAEDASMSEENLLSIAEHFLKTGIMRRYAAILRHNIIGYLANAIVCWKVDNASTDAAAANLALDPSVSHCYIRPTYPNWPYSLYTMVHSKTETALNNKIKMLADKSSLTDYQILNSIKEYKKSRVIYFNDL